jgi:hypothetical protein
MQCSLYVQSVVTIELLLMQLVVARVLSHAVTVAATALMRSVH